MCNDESVRQDGVLGPCGEVPNGDAESAERGRTSNNGSAEVSPSLTAKEWPSQQILALLSCACLARQACLESHCLFGQDYVIEHSV